MDQAVQDLLTAADRLGEWEYPADDYDYRNLWANVDALIPQLQSLVGYKHEVDRCV